MSKLIWERSLCHPFWDNFWLVRKVPVNVVHAVVVVVVVVIVHAHNHAVRHLVEKKLGDVRDRNPHHVDVIVEKDAKDVMKVLVSMVITVVVVIMEVSVVEVRAVRVVHLRVRAHVVPSLVLLVHVVHLEDSMVVVVLVRLKVIILMVIEVDMVIMVIVVDLIMKSNVVLLMGMTSSHMYGVISLVMVAMLTLSQGSATTAPSARISTSVKPVKPRESTHVIILL